MNKLLDSILNETLRVEYSTGDITTTHRPYTTGWRNLPCLMLSYQKAGKCRILLKDRPSQQVEEKELIAIPPGISHCSVLESAQGLYHWVHLNYFVLGNLDLFNFVKIPLIIKGKIADRISDMIRNWILFLRKSSPDDFIRIHARKNETSFNILNELSPLLELYPENQTRLKYIHQIQPALERIHEKYLTLSGRDELATCCHISNSQFHRVFFRAMGVGPMEYVRNLRIRHAQRLLISTDLPVGEISRLSGYSDPFIFSRYFKLKSGQNPSRYRQNVQSNVNPRPES